MSTFIGFLVLFVLVFGIIPLFVYTSSPTGSGWRTAVVVWFCIGVVLIIALIVLALFAMAIIHGLNFQD
jgi:hypothetical protein